MLISNIQSVGWTFIVVMTMILEFSKVRGTLWLWKRKKKHGKENVSIAINVIIAIFNNNITTGCLLISGNCCFKVCVTTVLAFLVLSLRKNKEQVFKRGQIPTGYLSKSFEKEVVIFFGYFFFISFQHLCLPGMCFALILFCNRKHSCLNSKSLERLLSSVQLSSAWEKNRGKKPPLQTITVSLSCFQVITNVPSLQHLFRIISSCPKMWLFLSLWQYTFCSYEQHVQTQMRFLLKDFLFSITFLLMFKRKPKEKLYF